MLQVAKVVQRAGLDTALAALTAGTSAPAVQRMLDRQASAVPGGKGKPPAAPDATGTPPAGLDTILTAAGDSKGGKRSGASRERRSQPRAVKGAGGSSDKGSVRGCSPDRRVGGSSPACSSPASRTPPAALAAFAATPLGSSRPGGGGVRRSGSGAVPSPARSLLGFHPSPGSVESSPMLLPAASPIVERPPAELTLPSQVLAASPAFVDNLLY